jgi:hypothetical protein
MGRFPITYTDATVSGRGPAVRGDFAAGATGAAVGKGLVQLAGQGIELWKKYDLKEVNTQFSKYTSDVGLLNVQRDAEALNADDADEVVAIYKKYSDLRDNIKPKNKRALRAVGIWEDEQRAIDAKSLFDARRKVTIDNERTRLFEKQQEVLNNPAKLAEFEKQLARSQFLDKNSPDDIGPTFTKLEAAKMLIETRKMAVQGQVVNLYRTGFHDEARKALEASSLGVKEKEILSDEIDIDERTKIVEFESGINSELVRIDNTEDMTQADFNKQAKALKERVRVAKISGTAKRKMLTDLERWRRGTNEIDYARILSLNQEMDAAQRSGIVDPTIQTRIMQASLEGAFGGRLKGGQKTYGNMIRRFEKLQFDERLQATSSIVSMFERENADDPRLIFLFHEAKNKFIAEHPDIDTKELFIKISGLAESYDVLPESVIKKKMKKTVIMTDPKGHMYIVPTEKRQLFLDNGYTEQ